MLHFHVIDQRWEVAASDLVSCKKVSPKVPLGVKRYLVVHRLGPEIVDEHDARLIARPITGLDVARLFAHHDGLPRPNLSKYSGGRMAYGAVLSPLTGALYQCLPFNAKMASNAPHNTDSFSLAVLHDMSKSALTAFGLHCLIESIKYLMREYQLLGVHMELVGHDDVGRKLKGCPGEHLDMNALRSALDGMRL